MINLVKLIITISDLSYLTDVIYRPNLGNPSNLELLRINLKPVSYDLFETMSPTILMVIFVVLMLSFDAPEE